MTEKRSLLTASGGGGREISTATRKAREKADISINSRKRRKVIFISINSRRREEKIYHNNRSYPH